MVKWLPIEITPWILALTILALSTINQFDPFSNNYFIFLIEMSLSIFVLMRYELEWPASVKICLLVLIWFSSVAFSTLLAHFQPHSTATWARVAEEGMHVFFGWNVWRLIRLNQRSWVSVIAFSWVLGAFIALVSIIYRWNILSNPRGVGVDWTSNLPLFANLCHMGYLISVAVIAQFFIFLRAQKNSSIWASLLSLILLNAFLMWIGRRATLLSTSIALLTMAFFMGRPTLKRSLWLLMSLPISLLLCEYFAVGNLGLFGTFHRTLAGVAEGVDQLSSGRWHIWLNAWRHVLVQPWFGYGAEGYIGIRSGDAISGGILHPHNVFIQCLVEWGFVGTLIFIALFYQWLKPLVQRLRSQYRQLNYQADVLLGSAVAGNLLLVSLSEGIFYHGTHTAFLALSIGLALGAQLNQTDSRLSASVRSL